MNDNNISTCYPPAPGDCENDGCEGFETYIPKWGGGEPSDTLGEDCVIMSPGENSNGIYANLNDGGCSSTRRFACNYDPSSGCVSANYLFPTLFPFMDIDLLIIGLFMSNILVICLSVFICYRSRLMERGVRYGVVKGVYSETEEDEQEQVRLK